MVRRSFVGTTTTSCAVVTEIVPPLDICGSCANTGQGRMPSKAKKQIIPTLLNLRVRINFENNMIELLTYKQFSSTLNENMILAGFDHLCEELSKVVGCVCMRSGLERQFTRTS